jgi:hypothetical protein
MKGDRPRDHACPTCKAKPGVFCEVMPADNGSLLGSHKARMVCAWEVSDRIEKRGRWAP